MPASSPRQLRPAGHLGSPSTLPPGHLCHMGLESPSNYGPINEEANRTLVWGHLPVGRGRPLSSSCEGEKGRLFFEQVRRPAVARSLPLPFDRFFFGKSSSCPSVPLRAPHPQTVEFRRPVAVRQINFYGVVPAVLSCRPGHAVTVHTPNRFLTFSHLHFSRPCYRIELRRAGQLLPSTSRT